MIKEALFEYLLAGVLIIIPLTLIYFEFKDYKKNKKIKNSPKKNQKYIEKINEIKIVEAYTTLDEIDLIAKDYFKELFKIEKFPGYYLIQKKFLEENKKLEAFFCKKMNEFLYEKVKPNKKEIKKLLKRFESLVIENQIK